MNLEEIDEPKKYEIYHAKPVLDPFKSINMQARRYVNCDKFRLPPRSRTLAFYHYRQNPKY